MNHKYPHSPDDIIDDRSIYSNKSTIFRSKLYYNFAFVAMQLYAPQFHVCSIDEKLHFFQMESAKTANRID